MTPFSPALFPPHFPSGATYTPALGGAGAGAGLRLLYLQMCRMDAVPGSLPAHLLFASPVEYEPFRPVSMSLQGRRIFSQKKAESTRLSAQTFRPGKGDAAPPAPVRLYPVGAGLFPARRAAKRPPPTGCSANKTPASGSTPGAGFVFLQKG